MAPAAYTGRKDCRRKFRKNFDRNVLCLTFARNTRTHAAATLVSNSVPVPKCLDGGLHAGRRFEAGGVSILASLQASATMRAPVRRHAATTVNTTADQAPPWNASHGCE